MQIVLLSSRWKHVKSKKHLGRLEDAATWRDWYDKNYNSWPDRWDLRIWREVRVNRYLFRIRLAFLVKSITVDTNDDTAWCFICAPSLVDIFEFLYVRIHFQFFGFAWFVAYTFGSAVFVWDLLAAAWTKANRAFTSANAPLQFGALV